MNIIHIDAENRQVKPVTIRDDEDGAYLDIKALVKGHFSAPDNFPNGDIMYAFDEVEHPPYGFSLLGGRQNYYVGNALIVGTMGDQETSCVSTLKQIQDRIIF